MQLRELLCIGAFCAAALLAAAPPAHAAAGAGAAEGSTLVTPVIVTAEKRAANVQTVAQAITVFTARQRALTGVSEIQDMTNFTPGLTYSGQLDRPVIRGVARNTNNYLTDSGVAVYNDDLYSTTTFLVGRDDLLIDQVSVQLGPQGTLYGRNAIGGLINTHSRRPTDVWSGEVRAEAGNFGYSKFEATLSGPIAEGLSFRLSGYDVEQDRGWFKNLIGGELGGIRHDPYGDIQLQYKGAKDDLWLDAYTFAFNGDRTTPGALIGTPTTGPYEGALVGLGELFYNANFPYSGGAVPGQTVGMIPGITNNPTDRNIRQVALSQGTDIHLSAAYAFNFHWTHHFDGVDLKYVGGYSQVHYGLTTNDFLNGQSSITRYQIPIAPGGQCDSMNNMIYPGSCQPLTVYPNQVYGFASRSSWSSHELTATSTGKGPLQWIAGLYSYDEHNDNPMYEAAPDQPQLAAPIDFATGLPAAPNKGGRYLFLDYQDHIQSWAGYAQLDWRLTDQIKLTGGLRYTYDRKTASEESRYIAFGAQEALSPGTGCLSAYAGLCAVTLPDGYGYNAGNLGAFMPALDVTSGFVDPSPYKGVSCAAHPITSGQYAGDWGRCLADNSSALSGTVGIEWAPDAQTLAYARYNRGYKAFAFNAGYIGSKPEAAPEFIDDFEVGLKKTFGRSFQLDVDGYYMNYQNDQVSIATLTQVGALTEFVNVPRSVSRGVELTAIWTPVRRLNFSLMYAFDDTQILSACRLSGGVPSGFCVADSVDPYAVALGAQPVDPVHFTGIQSVKGNPLPQTPRNKVALNGNYTWRFEPGELTFSASYIWKDASQYSIFNSRQFSYAPSWDQVDLRATWSGDHDHYQVVLYVKNLFDTLGYDAAAGGGFATNAVGTGRPAWAQSYDLTPPRQFGAELHYKF
jgi:iron complex outermembrane receptor protein